MESDNGLENPNETAASLDQSVAPENETEVSQFKSKVRQINNPIQGEMFFLEMPNGVKIELHSLEKNAFELGTFAFNILELIRERFVSETNKSTALGVG